jgi:hypothetical protein
MGEGSDRAVVAVVGGRAWEHRLRLSLRVSPFRPFLTRTGVAPSVPYPLRPKPVSRRSPKVCIGF